jgi:hypothetical protein
MIILDIIITIIIMKVVFMAFSRFHRFQVAPLPCRQAQDLVAADVGHGYVARPGGPFPNVCCLGW